ncbi:hypothetical protein C0993_009499, partial [Termitomyces sp. T159_Od127]
IPIQLCTDCGSETTLLYSLQNALCEIFHSDIELNELPAHIYLLSVNNIVVERSWGHLQLDWEALLSGDNGPVKSANDARHWMETKGWILAGEPYNRTKLVALVTRGTQLDSNVQNTVLAVAFLLEDDINDQSAKAIAQVVAAKVLGCIGDAAASLSTLSEFVSATSTSQAETTVALKEVSKQITVRFR